MRWVWRPQMCSLELQPARARWRTVSGCVDRNWPGGRRDAARCGRVGEMRCASSRCRPGARRWRGASSSPNAAVSGGLPRLFGVAACPVDEVEHLLQDLDDGNLTEEREAVGASVAGGGAEAGCAGVGAADRTVHYPLPTTLWGSKAG